MDIHEIINKIYPMPESSVDKLKRLLSKVTYPKGHLILEGSTIVSLKSYVNNRQGYETVELMENSVLYMLKRKELYELFEEDTHIANWGRKFAETEFLQTEERLISLLFTTASERYRELLKDNPDLLQRMPLECLASYLGITPVSLSRIRAKLKREH